MGKMAEVIVFKEELSDESAFTVMRTLSSKYATPVEVSPPEIEERVPDEAVAPPLPPSLPEAAEPKPQLQDQQQEQQQQRVSEAPVIVMKPPPPVDLPEVAVVAPPQLVTKAPSKVSGPLPEGENACSSFADPFKNQPVDSFKPPKGARFEDVMEWEDVLKTKLDAITKMTVGGEPLREFMRKEVKTLQLLRFKLFCKYVPSVE